MKENPQAKKDRKLRILVIDDDEDFLELLRYRFERENCEYEVAYDGDEGLLKVKTFAPDLILVDIKMPRMDGYSFIRELKREEATSKIPVIVLTSYEPMRDLFTMEGVQDYVVKSSDMTVLWGMVSKHF